MKKSLSNVIDSGTVVFPGEDSFYASGCISLSLSVFLPIVSYRYVTGCHSKPTSVAVAAAQRDDV